MAAGTDQPVTATQTAAGGGGGVGAIAGGVHDDDDRRPSPAAVRTVLVRVVALAGADGVPDDEAEREVAAAFPSLEDPVDADIDGLIALGVLTRRDDERLVATDVAEHYVIGARIATRA